MRHVVAGLLPGPSSIWWGVGTGALGGLLFVALCAGMSPFMALLAFAGLIGIALILVSPRLGFLLTAAVVPLERFGRFTDDRAAFSISLMRLVGVITLASLLVHVALRNRKLHLGLPFCLYALYTGVCFLSVLHTTDPAGTIRFLPQLVVNLMFLFTVVNIVDDFALARRGVILWLVVSVLIGLVTAYQWHADKRETVIAAAMTSGDRWATVVLDNSEGEGSLRGIRRATGSTSHPAVYGLNLVLTIPFLAFLLHRARSWRTRLLLILSLGLIVYNTVLTNTRATVATALLVLLLCVGRGLLRIRRPALVLGGVVLLATLSTLGPSTFPRIFDARNYTFQESSTMRIRVAYWKVALKLIGEHPWTGIGVGNDAEIPKHVREPGVPEKTTSHNEYLQTLMEVGLIGWVPLLLFVFLVLRYSFTAAHRIRCRDPEVYGFLVACQIAMIAALLYGLQCEVFHFPLKTWWLVAGLTTALHRLGRRVPEPLSSAPIVLAP